MFKDISLGFAAPLAAFAALAGIGYATQTTFALVAETGGQVYVMDYGLTGDDCSAALIDRRAHEGSAVQWSCEVER